MTIAMIGEHMHGDAEFFLVSFYWASFCLQVLTWAWRAPVWLPSACSPSPGWPGGCCQVMPTDGSQEAPAPGIPSKRLGNDFSIYHILKGSMTQNFRVHFFHDAIPPGHW
jgi:hypothetical protein